MNNIAIARLQYLLINSSSNWEQMALALSVVLLYFMISPWLEAIYDFQVQESCLNEIPGWQTNRLNKLADTVNNAYYSEQFLKNIKLEKDVLSKMPIYIMAKFGLAKHVLNMVVYFGIFFYLFPRSFLLSLVLLSLSFIVKYILYAKQLDYQIQNVEEDKKAEYFRNVLLDSMAMRDLKVYGYEKKVSLKSIDAFKIGLKKRYKLRRKNAMWYPLTKSSVAAVVGLILYGITKSGEFNPADIAVAAASVLSIVSRMEPLCDQYFVYRESADLRKENDVVEQKYPKYLRYGVCIDRITEIRFEDVSFEYEANNPILQHLDFTWEASAGISVIGDNGAGKTTLMKLLLGINQPTSGSIYVNGIPLTQVNLTSYLRCFGFCMQDYVVFADELLGNIAFGDVQKEMRLREDKDVQEILDFVQDLPHGLSTIVGTEIYQNGVVLSGGQEQRVALSRAIVGGRQVLVLDEPTSALDPEMEGKFLEFFKRQISQRPVFLITHRIGFAGLCDRILVMNNGRIVEDNNHDELLKMKGYYYRIYQTQLKMYRDEGERNE